MLTDLESLAAQAATGDGRGGRRPNSGRKRADGKNRSTKEPQTDVEVRTVDQLLDDGPPPPLIDTTQPVTDDAGGLEFKLPENPGSLYAGAKARKEAALAAKAELEFRVKAGQYLPREAVRMAQAKAFQAVSQAMRSIPDNIERKLGVAPELAELVGRYIDDAMGELSYAMEQIHTENNGILDKN